MTHSIYAAAAGMLDEQRARADRLALEYRELEAKYAAQTLELNRLRAGHSRRLKELEKKVKNASPAFENLKYALELWKNRAHNSEDLLRGVYDALGRDFLNRSDTPGDLVDEVLAEAAELREALEAGCDCRAHIPMGHRASCTVGYFLEKTPLGRGFVSPQRLREVAEKAFGAGRSEAERPPYPNETTEQYNERLERAFEEVMREMTQGA